MGIVETKTFKSGNSVAVRLPKELGLDAGITVTLEKIADGVRLIPTDLAKVDRRRLEQMVAALKALGPGEIEQREPFDGPERESL